MLCNGLKFFLEAVKGRKLQSHLELIVLTELVWLTVFCF